MKLRQPAVSDHPTNHDLERLLHRLDDGDFTACCGCKPGHSGGLAHETARMAIRQKIAHVAIAGSSSSFPLLQTPAICAFGLRSGFRQAAQFQRLQRQALIR